MPVMLYLAMLVLMYCDTQSLEKVCQSSLLVECHASLEVVCQLFNSSLMGFEFIIILTYLIFCFSVSSLS